MAMEMQRSWRTESSSGFVVALAAAVAVALALTLALPSPAAANSATDCRVRNLGSGRTFTSVQKAVDAARRGARLTVRGTCTGATVIRRSIAITGVETKRWGPPLLSGGGKARVLKISNGARVKLSDLAVVRGRAVVGAGIHNRGTLVLANVQVRRNRAIRVGYGGGIRNYGTIRMNRGSRVSANHGNLAGGVTNHGLFVMNGTSAIAGNIGTCQAGVFNDGTFIMNGSSTIAHNRYRIPPVEYPCYYRYAGSGATNLGRLTMNGGSSIRNNGSRNTAVRNGGTLTMNHRSTIAANRGTHPAGGLENWSRVVMNDASSIVGNRGADVVGGAYLEGSLTMNDDSSIADNANGGVYVWESGVTLTMNDRSSIRGNRGWFGGVQLLEGTLRMAGTSSITGNVAGEGPGGGVLMFDRYDAEADGMVCAPDTPANVYGNTPSDCVFVG